MLAAFGLVGAVGSLVLFPQLQRRFNNQNMYAFFAAFYSIGFAVMPLGYLAARYGGEPDGTNEKTGNAAVWTAIAIILIPVRIALFAFPYVGSYFIGTITFLDALSFVADLPSLFYGGSTQLILVRSSIADSSHLGAMFGLQQTFCATARAIAPAFTSTLFALSVDYQILGGQGVWVVMVLVSLVTLRTTVVTSAAELPRKIETSWGKGKGKAVVGMGKSRSVSRD